MTAERRLAIQLVSASIAVLAAVMVPIWLVSTHLAERDALHQIDEVFDDIADDIADTVDMHLVRKAMEFRDLLKGLDDLSCPTLRKVADDLGVDELCVVDANGILTHSARPEDIGLDFRKVGGQAGEFLCLLDEESEYAQALMPNSLNGDIRKYAGVWLPEGGFVQAGALVPTLQRLVQSSLVGILNFWHVGDDGTLAIVSKNGRVMSATDADLEGSIWDDTAVRNCYWKKRDIFGFDTYGMIPKANAAEERDIQFALSTTLVAIAIFLVIALAAFLISRYVKRKIEAQAAREMMTARNIQAGALPRTFPPFPDVKEFDLFAKMTPAKTVGGDFYDFYFVNNGEVLFLVADVSGKGVPAALFMMKAKSIIKGLAMTGKSLDAVIAEANDQLCEGNDANMFVTLWAGVIELASGKVTYVNAGHNPPIVIGADGKAEYLKGHSGIVLGAMAGVPYRTSELQLDAGGGIYLYTDGITEQPNRADELFGEARALAAVERTGLDDLGGLCAKMEKEVIAHAGGVEQADDCTQLALRYRGGEKLLEKSYVATMPEVAKATADLEVALADVPAKERMQLMVASDEVIANIVRHSGANQWSLRVERAEHPSSVKIVFTDDGVEFDPLKSKDPDVTLSAEERAIGGLGLLIVKKTMSPVTYQRRNGFNIMSITKKLG